MDTDAEVPGMWSSLGDSIVRIKVGKDKNKKLFAVHQDLICSKSVVFEKMFNSGFKEAQKKSATLPEDNPDAFALFVNWLYTGKFLQIPLAGEFPCLYNFTKELIYFAEKYCIPELIDRSITANIWYLKTRATLPMKEDVKLAYKHCPQGSKYRAFNARCVLYAWTSFPEIEKMEISVDQNIHDLLSKNKELLMDVIKWGHGNQAVINPITLQECVFHQHANAIVCPYVNFGKQIDKAFEA